MTTSTQPALQTFTIDPQHSRLGFTVRHMGFSKVRGNFEQFEGVVRMAPDQLETLEAEVTVQTDSITTGTEDRDEHLRSRPRFCVKSVLPGHRIRPLQQQARPALRGAAPPLAERFSI